MDHIVIKKTDSNFYKTLNKVYNEDYYNIGNLKGVDFNEKIIILVRSGLTKDEIKELIVRGINGEDNEFSYYIDDTIKKIENSYINNIMLVLFGIVVTLMIINLVI